MKLALITGAVSAVVVAAAVQLSSPPVTTLGQALKARGFTHAVFVAHQMPVANTGPIDYDSVLDWSLYGVGAGTDPSAWDVAYFARYRAHSRQSYGQPSRVSFCRPAHAVDEQLLQRIVRSQSNPLGIERNTKWEPDRTDLEDVKLATGPSGSCSDLAWDRFLYPLACSLRYVTDGCDVIPTPTPEPPPPPTPEPTPTPEPDPEPTPGPIPDPPPPPGTPDPPNTPISWGVQQKACSPNVRPGTLCLELMFRPAYISTGQLYVTISD